MLFFFTVILNVNKDNPGHPLRPSTCSTSIILFTYFQEATAGLVPSLVGRENLVRKVRFPRLVVPTVGRAASLFNLGMNLIVVFVFIARRRHRRRCSAGSS